MTTTFMSSFPQPHDSLPSCPICPYTAPSCSERDLYMLVQHVELSHPENGESPFIARDASPAGQQRRPTSNASSRSDAGRGSRSSSLAPTPNEADGDFYVDCPLRCGEAVHMRELEDHMDLHDIEGQCFEETEHASPSRHASPVSRIKRSNSTEAPARDAVARERSSSRRAGELLHVPRETTLTKHHESPSRHGLKELLLGPAPRKTRPLQATAKHGGVRRLGKAELGPHAFEEEMPAWLFKQLDRGAKVTLSNVIGPEGKIVRIESVANETPGIIPVLAQLCAQDPSLFQVFLCHPSVKHIFKTPREGGFCGYRNIQMLVSFMQGTNFPGSEHFPGRTPSIPRLQDIIEAAWDQGFNSSGRIETGGIRGTRKYIGTPEAQALFCSLDIGCEANAFNKSRDPEENGIYVHDRVLQAVLAYFSTGVTDAVEPAQKVYQTGLAPIYFQHPGHSLTIVGLEIRKSGSMNLLVFDPMFKTAPGIAQLMNMPVRVRHPERLLKAFRRGDSYLGKYNSFEILKLMAPTAHPKQKVITV